MVNVLAFGLLVSLRNVVVVMEFLMHELRCAEALDVASADCQGRYNTAVCDACTKYGLWFKSTVDVYWFLATCYLSEIYLGLYGCSIEIICAHVLST